MKLRHKIILFAVMPLVLALCAIALTVRHHAISLAQQEQEVIKPTYLASKEAELKNYVALATHAIAHLYKTGRTDAAAKNEAKAILEKLEYGDDGYFFVYDLQGTLLIHPRQQGWVGKNMWDFKDVTGKLIIQSLISRAHAGGFENFVWPKPSSGSPDPKPKRAYVIELPAWGWVLGTGIYLDDVDDALAEIDSQVSRNIDNTMLWIAAIAFLSAAAIFLGLLLNIRERTVVDDKLSVANTKLKALAQRVIKARDEERERIENDLHDGLKPMLVAVKLKIETGVIQLPKAGGQITPAENTFKSAAGLLKDSLGELTHIIRDIRPWRLNSLAQRLKQLTFDMAHPGMPIEFCAEGEIHGFSNGAEEALLMIAKEALTNIIAHAAAHQAAVRLESTEHCVKLAISDDGDGFDVNHINDNPGRGIGLSSMKKRLASVGGQLTITSLSSGTTVLATIPLP